MWSSLGHAVVYPEYGHQEIPLFLADKKDEGGQESEAKGG
jgi:hypothetical protein